MSDVAIMNALFARLAALTLSPVHPISWPNANFTPPTNGRFLRATLLPASKVRFPIAADGMVEHIGIMQVDVFAPLNGGLSPVLATAQAVATHFKSGTFIMAAPRVEITRAEVNAGLPMGERFMVPVSISYRSFAPNN
jgi:hypothetical protein